MLTRFDTATRHVTPASDGPGFDQGEAPLGPNMLHVHVGRLLSQQAKVSSDHHLENPLESR